MIYYCCYCRKEIDVNDFNSFVAVHTFYGIENAHKTCAEAIKNRKKN